MTLGRAVGWVNRLLEPFSLKLVRGDGFKLELLSDIVELIRRKNPRGWFCEDRRNLLKQVMDDGCPFVDELTGETGWQKRERARAPHDASRLDVGINPDA
jgi:hypothetical protein